MEEVLLMDKEVKSCLAAIENERKREDAQKLIEIMQEETGYQPYMDGRIISFGSYHYRYESGREGDCCITGFAPAKQRISIYIMPGFSNYQDELSEIGKHKTGKCCLYINKLADVDEVLLRKIIKHSVEDMKSRYPCSDFPPK